MIKGGVCNKIFRTCTFNFTKIESGMSNRNTLSCVRVLSGINCVILVSK